MSFPLFTPPKRKASSSARLQDSLRAQSTEISQDVTSLRRFRSEADVFRAGVQNFREELALLTQAAQGATNTAQKRLKAKQVKTAKYKLLFGIARLLAAASPQVSLQKRAALVCKAEQLLRHHRNGERSESDSSLVIRLRSLLNRRQRDVAEACAAIALRALTFDLGGTLDSSMRIRANRGEFAKLREIFAVVSGETEKLAREEIERVWKKTIQSTFVVFSGHEEEAEWNALLESLLDASEEETKFDVTERENAFVVTRSKTGALRLGDVFSLIAKLCAKNSSAVMPAQVSLNPCSFRSIRSLASLLEHSDMTQWQGAWLTLQTELSVASGKSERVAAEIASFLPSLSSAFDWTDRSDSGLACAITCAHVLRCLVSLAVSHVSSQVARGALMHCVTAHVLAEDTERLATTLHELQRNRVATLALATQHAVRKWPHTKQAAPTETLAELMRFLCPSALLFDTLSRLRSEHVRSVETSVFDLVVDAVESAWDQKDEGKSAQDAVQDELLQVLQARRQLCSQCRPTLVCDAFCHAIERRLRQHRDLSVHANDRVYALGESIVSTLRTDTARMSALLKCLHPANSLLSLRELLTQHSRADTCRLAIRRLDFAYLVQAIFAESPQRRLLLRDIAAEDTLQDGATALEEAADIQGHSGNLRNAFAL
ncbi:MAG: hypothetical protein MHM6MM_006258 [Cercozoa sp. M6MM]